MDDPVNAPRSHAPPPVVTAGYAIVALAAAGYIVARAWIVPLTYDEAVIALRYMSAPWIGVFEVGSGTNHFLNTVLARAASAAFGAEPWAMRLPNVAAGIAYLAAMAGITRRASSPSVGLAGFVLLTAHPFLLDYFAVSRGYGLAIGLLSVSLWALLRWCGATPGARAARRDLGVALASVGAAVAASFTVLPAATGVMAVVLARLLWLGPVQTDRSWSWSRLGRDALVWALATGLFSLLVFSRDRELSPRLFAPLTVRVSGLFAEELAGIEVFRADAAGRFHPLDRLPDGTWSLSRPRGVWGLRVDLPAATDRNLSVLEVAIGPEVFRRTRHSDGPWTVTDTPTHRVLRAGPGLMASSAAPGRFGAINGGSDDARLRMALAYAATTLAVLAGLGLVIVALFRLIAHWRGVPAADLRMLLAAGMGAASLCAAPAYLLRANNQLYFGGNAGLLADTFGSVMASVVYTVPAFPGQGTWAAVVLAFAAANAIAALSARRPPSAPGPAVLAAILGVAAVQIELQHRLAGTPYLTDRTALFLLPLLMLSVFLAADVLAARAKAARMLVTGVVGIAAAVAAWHAIGVANLSRSRDVPDDAATPAMLEAVAAAVGAESRPAPVVRVGVEWYYYPVAQVYAARQSTPLRRFDVVVVPTEAGDPPVDFVYARNGSPLGTGERLRDFAVTQAALWRRR